MISNSKMNSSFILYIFSLWFCAETIAGLGTKLNLPAELISKKDFTVYVFMNKNCPCTNHNIKYLNSMQENFENIEFIGIHSFKNTKSEDVQKYAEEKNINFKLINDEKLLFANLFEANRTPQIFITNKNNEIVYIGGVTNRTNPDTASEFYLKNALVTITNTNHLPPTEHKSLGCFIVR